LLGQLDLEKPMPNKETTNIFRRALTPGIIAAAGLAVTLSFVDTSDAISRRRDQLGIRVWEEIGITGSGVVLGSLDGLPPLVDNTGPFFFTSEHQSIRSSSPIEIVFEEDGVMRRTLANFSLHAHQTATIGAMVANKVGTRSDAPLGIAPDAQLLVGWFAIDRDPSGGFVDLPGTPTGQIFDAITYSLFGMTGQEYANVISNSELDIPAPYQVATVVNSSFGVEGPAGRRGEDQIARIYNACVTMTDATLVCPTSNDGNLEDPTGDEEDPTLTDLGRVYSPGSAHNTIAVGYVGREFNAISSFSGAGPIQAQNYADMGLGDLYPDDLNFVNPFTPEDGGDLESTAGVFREVRAGPDIVAPGELLQLPGETFVVSGNVFNTVASSQWTGVSFASAIVASAAGLVHELGEREGHSISSVVTRAVLINSANRSDENIGVGFDNEQMVDQMDEDRPSITTIGLDPDAGGGSLDLTRLLRQYHQGTVVTDYMPGDGLIGLTTFSDVPNQHDSLVYAIQTTGTDPTIPFVTPQRSNPPSPRPLSLTCVEGLGGVMLDPNMNETRDPWLDGRIETRVASYYGPFTEQVEAVIDQTSAKIVPMARRDNPDLDGGEPSLGDGNTGGSVPGAGGEDVGSGGGAAGGGRPFRSGWDHGMVGEGHVDLPIGPITPGSGISVTLTWNRHESWQLPASNFNGVASIVAFGGGSEGNVAALDPVQMNQFEYEDLNLELWQVPSGPGGNRLVAASRGVWNNTESIYFEYIGGAPDGTSNGPFGNAPADHFVRVIFQQTLWDYGGFWFCNGPPLSMPKEAEGLEDFDNLNRAQVEYGLAWYVEFNTDGYLDALRAINPDTGAVDLSIIGIITNLDRQFFPLVGDVNADFLVDSTDASLMIRNFGSSNANYDLNGDGIVDALDLQMVSMHIGEVAEPRKLTKEEKKAEKQRRKDYKKMVKERQKANKKANKQQGKDMRSRG